MTSSINKENLCKVEKAMKPILFTLFGLTIYGYGLMIAIGIISGILLLSYRAKEKGYNEDNILNMAIFAVIGGILGGKILYLITDYKVIAEDPSIIIKNFGEGFVVYGSIIGGVIAVYIYCKNKKWHLWSIVDLVIPSVALGQAFGRIGCFLAGCCYGAATNLPIGVEFSNSPFAPSGVHLHPTQLYSSAFNFLLTFFLLWYDKKKKREGSTFGLYLIVYSIGRFFVEFIRDDPRGNVGILSTSQFIAIITLILGLLIFYFQRNKGRVNNIEEK